MSFSALVPNQLVFITSLSVPLDLGESCRKMEYPPIALLPFHTFQTEVLKVGKVDVCNIKNQSKNIIS